MDRQLIDYLPDVTGETKDFKALMGVEQPELETVWDLAEALLNSQFILDADETGVRRWEKMLKILPKAADSLGERKLRVLIKLNEYLPYTMRALKRMLATLCGGDDGYSVSLENDIYSLFVKVRSALNMNYYDIYELLRRVIPANLILNMKAESELAVGVLAAARTFASNRITALDVDMSYEITVGQAAAVCVPLVSGVYHKTVLGEPEVGTVTAVSKRIEQEGGLQ